jgi:DNA-binding beta-propeller fold protein YncE
MRHRIHSLSLPLLLSALALATPAAMAADQAPLAVVGSITAADGPWDYASVDADLHRLYVARGDGVMAVNLDTGAVTPSFVPGKRVHGVITRPGGIGVTTNGDTSSATLFKVSDGSVLADLPAGKKPDAVVRDAKSGLVVVMNGNDGTATLIDADAKKVVGAMTIGGKLEFAIADGSGHVFVNVEDKNEMVELDIPSRTVMKHLPLAGCDEPTGLDFDPASHVMVAACANGKAAAVSTTDFKQIATIAIGEHPDATIFDPKNKRFLIPCGGNGVLSVITEEADGSLKAGAQIVTAKGARTGAIDPVTGKVYLPTAEFSAAKAGERPAAVPGTFHILVLGQR